jgi:hypothetical protein
MKITDICESTTAGSIATVAASMTGGPLKRSAVGKGVYGKEPKGSMFTGKKTSKPFANSKINEAAREYKGEQVTVLYIDNKPAVKYTDIDKAKKELQIIKSKFPNKKVELKQEVREAKLDEDDLIIVPGQGHKRGGFISRADDRRDHEVEMARGDLYQAHKNSSKIHKLIKNVTEDEGLEGWVQAKITKAADYLNSVRQYLEGKQLQEMTGGVIAGGGVGEGLSEGKQETYNLRDLGNDLSNYVGSDSESVLVTKILNILRNNYTDSRGASLPNREISGSELMALYGISERQQGAFINFIDKVYGGPKKDEEDSYNSFRFDEEADLLDEGMGLKQLAAAAAAVGYMLVPNSLGNGERSTADSAYDSYQRQTPSHLVPRYTTPNKGK